MKEVSKSGCGFRFGSVFCAPNIFNDEFMAFIASSESQRTLFASSCGLHLLYYISIKNSGAILDQEILIGLSMAL